MKQGTIPYTIDVELMEEKALGNPRETNLKVWKWLERWLAVVRLAPGP